MRTALMLPLPVRMYIRHVHVDLVLKSSVQILQWSWSHKTALMSPSTVWIYIRHVDVDPLLQSQVRFPAVWIVRDCTDVTLACQDVHQEGWCWLCPSVWSVVPPAVWIPGDCTDVTLACQDVHQAGWCWLCPAVLSVAPPAVWIPGDCTKCSPPKP